MIVRIKFQRGLALARHLSLSCAALLMPISLMAYALGLWRLASDMGMAGAFVYSGLFSHWQVWLGLALSLNASAFLLNRYGRGQDLPAPRVLMLRLGLKLPRPRLH